MDTNKKKWTSRLWNVLLGTALLGSMLTSCVDDEFPSMHGTTPLTRSIGAIGSDDGLVEQNDGYWKATHRIPLVGSGRIVDNIRSSTGSIFTIPDGSNAVTNLDISDSYTVQSVLGLGTGASLIMSVRDLNYEYAGGQKAGFVCTALDDGILSLNVLKGYYLETYLHGKKTGEYTFNNDGVKSLVDLGLGNITGGNYDDKTEGNPTSIFCIEGTFDKPFDEIRLCISGVDVDLAGKLQIYYAYVGDNEMIPAISSRTDFFYNGVSVPWKVGDVSWISWSDENSANSLIDDRTDNGCTIELIMGVIGSISGGIHATVDFGREIEAGSEVGFVVTTGGLLELGGGKSVIIRTYNGEEDDPEKYTEQYTYTKMLSLGLLGGGRTKYSIKTTQPCQRVYLNFAGLDVKLLSATTINYAFVREPDKIDASSLFTLSGATVYTPSYRFADVPEKVGSVEFKLLESPYQNAKLEENENGEWVLTDMFVAGNYKVQGTFTYTDANGEQHQIVRTAIIRRLVKNQDYCNNHMTNGGGSNQYTAYQPENGFDGVLSIGGSGTAEGSFANIVDEDENNYVQFTEAVNVSLGTNTAIVGVKSSQSLNTDKKNMRVGFVIDRGNTILTANVLNFLRIRLLNKGEEVGSGVGKDNSGVSVSLLGTSTTGKARLSINTDEEFDAIELYFSGLLSLAAGNVLKVYYAFYEDASVDCGAPGEECMQLITNANYGATAEVTSSGLELISVFDNFGNILDGDMESYATIFQGVSLSGTTLSVKFDEIKGGQEIGLILSGIPGLIDLSGINVEIIKALYQGEPIAETTGGSGLGLKVAGNGDKTYLSITPPASTTIDEIQYVLGGLDVLKNIKIHGVYLRPDYDLDGVMDCVGDELTTSIVGLKPTPADICEGNSTSLVVSGGEEGKEYQLAIRDYKSRNSFDKTYTVKLNSSSEFEFVNGDPIPDLKPGIYYLTVENPANPNSPYINGIELTIHPHETEWTGTTSTDWNTWGNWTKGVPWDCSNVFIPANVEQYPVLSASGTEEYWCNNIHFAPGTELIGQSHLHYTQAFVDMNLSAGTYHLMSAPLQAMVTGDMFVTQNVTDWESWRATPSDNLHPNYFMPINGKEQGLDKKSSYSEQRNDPFIYQRFWSSAVRNETLTRAHYTTDKVITELTDWSRSFNAVETNYEVGQGFAVKAGDETNATPYHFHFPKSFSIYNYYGINGNSLKGSSIARTGQIGRLWTAEQINGLTLKRETSGTLYIFGNPFMAHINIKKFLEANSSSVSSVKVYKDGQYVDITSSNVANGAQIAPMQAVFLETKAEDTSYSVNLTEDMLEQGNSSGALTRALPEQLELLVTASGHTASCFVTLSSTANDSYDSREDALLLVGNEEGSGVAVFTAADGKALSIQRMKSATRIPVGFYLKQTGNVSLTFDDSDNAWNGWKLKDEQTGRSYPINGRITLNDVSTGSGRFFLEKVQ
ncbi:hypothetical protein [Bacteroides caecigallinarum]|uniref:hypothetical protein n=1 Tax=Bacteroides caecigallinarum TaxID=1411144 RepID=UPI001F1C00C2|nr:hypothetical protein [Bacteroides caecigallinarum]MCF2582272.1 hypothetical protein [Bacteroides caecigallinarum]